MCMHIHIHTHTYTCFGGLDGTLLGDLRAPLQATLSSSSIVSGWYSRFTKWICSNLRFRGCISCCKSYCHNTIYNRAYHNIIQHTRLSLLVWMECPARCSGGRRPLIAGCSSLQRLGVDLPLIPPVWESNLGPPASESRPFSQLSYRCH